MAKDFYKVLGVPKGASPEELKKAYRRLAHKFHPDKAKEGTTEHKEHEQRFKEINEAYQVLSDTNKRQQYDQFGATFDQGPAGSGYGQGFGQGGNVNVDFEDLEDLLGGVFRGFGGTRRGAKTKRGSDIQVTVTLSFSEAALGSSQKLRLYKHIACGVCAGDGAAKGSARIKCSECDGSGQKTDVQSTIFGSFQTVRTCETCAGRGTKPEHTCETCRGTGVVRDTVEVSVSIPPGVSDGDTLRVAGQGEAISGGHAGDLYVAVRVERDSRFERHGNDVVSRLAVSVPEAVLGTEKTVTTLDGDIVLTVPAGTASGAILRVPGRGIGTSGSRRGDHLVQVTVTIPSKLSKTARKLFEELGDAL
ncbi:MAG: molecular chaperone DnaJ [Patescibacteria group bacterium]